MAIPNYQECMLPLLEVLADGKDYPLRAVATALADRFGLTDEERKEHLPSGQQTVIANRVAWAKTYLKKAGLVAQPSRGVVRLTDGGRAALAGKPAKIDNGFLRGYPSFADFLGRTSAEPGGDVARTRRRRRRPSKTLTSNCGRPWRTTCWSG